MSCNQQGLIVGSLSGGCVEDDLLEKLQNGALANEKPQFFRYGESEEEAEQLGLPCGGHLDIVVEPIEPTDPNRRVFAHIAHRLRSRNCVLRVAHLDKGTTSSKDIDRFQDFAISRDRKMLSHTYGPRFQLIVIGSGMVSQYVAEMAIALDYHVIVCDPRKENIDAFPLENVEKSCEMPDDLILERGKDSQTAIVALTHDPRIDDMGLLGAFQTDAFYIGAMGSERTSFNRRARLRELEVSEKQLERLHAPIGLPIGSKTPPEIAVSVVAEITSIRRNTAVSTVANRQQRTVARVAG